jgi:hypothetical protein
VSTVVVHCESNCAGVNATSWASTNPPAMLLLSPKASATEKSAVLAELEAEPSPPTEMMPPGAIYLQVEEQQLEPTAELTQGVPTFGGAVTAEQFSEATVYAPVYEAISPDDLMGLIGPADKVEWVPVKTTPFACVDGRSAKGELHAHGGDFGEFLLALSVYEQMLQKQLSQAETSQLFSMWLGEGHRFSMCTDAAAVAQLASAVSYKYPLDLARPPEEHAASLMLRVIAPEFQGDGHTKWLLQHPDTYAVRRVLAEQLIRSFFGVLWNSFHPQRPKLTLHVFKGMHAERALIKVHGSHWCWAEQGLAPAIPAKTKMGSVFLYNVEAVTLRRSDLVNFFSSQVTPVAEPAEMGARMRALGDGQAHLTEKAQAGALRGYTVLFK